jgi:hypothetical protein
MPDAWWTIQVQLDQLAADVNKSLQESAARQSRVFMCFDGHIPTVNRVREMDLGAWHADFRDDSYNSANLVFKGWMTEEACKNAAATDFRTLYKIFVARKNGGRPDGERSAPANGGFPHIHVNGAAHNIVSFDDEMRVICFTGHMDNTGPGQREAAKAKTIKEKAARSGWVWVAFEKTPTQALRLVQLTL